jgi:hypothetical protein
MTVLAVAASGQAQGADDHSTAAALAQKLELDPVHGPITAAAVARAKEALERAARLRGAGDEAHAKAADGLAREWAETARDLARAADAEASASDLRRKAVDAQARLIRARALVEEGIARVGRLRAQLDEAGRAAPKDRTAVEVHDGNATPRPTPRPAANKPDSKDKPAKHSGDGDTP